LSILVRNYKGTLTSTRRRRYNICMVEW